MRLVIIIFIYIIFSAIFISNAFTQDLEEVRIAYQAKKYDEAKYLIDDLMKKNNNMADSKTWYYRGLVYYGIASDLRGSFVKLDSMALFKSYESYIKSIEANTSVYTDSSKIGLDSLFKPAVNAAGNYYKQAYALANGKTNLDRHTLDLYQKAYNTADLARKLNTKDTLAYSIAAYSALNMRDYQNYISITEDLIKIITIPKEKYKHYEGLLYVCRDVLDDNEFTLSVLEKALKEFPNDKKFEEARLKLNVDNDKEENLIKDAKEKIKKTPNEPLHYYNLAIIYQRYHRFDEAIENYKKCIQYDPSNFDAYFYIGGIYYNLGANYLKELNELTFTEFQKKGHETEKKAKKEFENALPYFEKLNILSPDNENILKPLYYIYKNLKYEDKMTSIKDKLLAMGVEVTE